MYAVSEPAIKLVPSPSAKPIQLFTHPQAGHLLNRSNGQRVPGRQFEVIAVRSDDSTRHEFSVVMPYGLTLNGNIERLLKAKTGISYVVIDKVAIDVPF